MRLRVSLTFALMSCVRAFVPPSHHVVVPSAKPDSVSCDREVHVVLLPGYDVAAERYVPLATSLRNSLAGKFVSASVYIAKYTHDTLSHFEAESRVAEIMASHENVVLVGHSQGAYLAAGIALRHKLPLIQWAGCNYDDTFASKMETTPLMTILCERDAVYPCLRAIAHTFDDHSANPTDPSKVLVTVPEAGHLHGVLRADTSGADAMFEETEQLATLLAAFVACNLFQCAKSRVQLAEVSGNTTRKYSAYLRERRPVYLSQFVERCQAYVNATESRVYNTHHSSLRHPVTTVLDIIMPWISVPLDLFVNLPTFITSQPSADETHSYVSAKKYGVIGSMMTLQNEEPCVMTKLKHDNPQVTAQEINKRTFAEALAMVCKEDRIKYVRSGKKMFFGSDMVVPHVPLCSVLWLAMPLSKRQGGNMVEVRSPVLKTAPGKGKYDGRLNAKLLTLPQALEWVLAKAFL